MSEEADMVQEAEGLRGEVKQRSVNFIREIPKERANGPEGLVWTAETADRRRQVAIGQDRPMCENLEKGSSYREKRTGVEREEIQGMGRCQLRLRDRKSYRRQRLTTPVLFVAEVEVVAIGNMARAVEGITWKSAMDFLIEVDLVIRCGEENLAMRGTNEIRSSADEMTTQERNGTIGSENTKENSQIRATPPTLRSLLQPLSRPQHSRRIRSMSTVRSKVSMARVLSRAADLQAKL